MEPIISLQNVGVKYKRRGSITRKKSYFEAIKSINLDIYKGETVGILGGNGAGKSTLLRVISGAIKPDSGKLINRGVSVSLLALQAGFDPNLTGRDNAIMSGMVQGHSKNYISSKINEIESYADLGDFFYEPVRIYSSGMRVRLGFAIANAANPVVLLLDEILAVGDNQFRQKAEKTMSDRIKSEQTIVLVSHSLPLITRLCDRVFFIKNKVMQLI